MVPYTLDVTDLLLTKLQIVELNAKDVHEVLHLLSGFEVQDGDKPGTIGLQRIGKIVGADWGWWRTVTGNLDKGRRSRAGNKDLVPEARHFEPVAQAHAIRGVCDSCPKTVKWKLGTKVGDRRRQPPWRASVPGHNGSTATSQPGAFGQSFSTFGRALGPRRASSTINRADRWTAIRTPEEACDCARTRERDTPGSQMLTTARRLGGRTVLAPEIDLVRAYRKPFWASHQVPRSMNNPLEFVCRIP